MKTRCLPCLLLFASLSLAVSHASADTVEVGDTYEKEVLSTGAGPDIYWRLAESSTSEPADNLGNFGSSADGEYGSTTILGIDGPLPNTPDTAAGFTTGVTTTFVRASSFAFPQSSFSTEFWINAPSAGAATGIVSYNSPGGENDMLVFDTNNLTFFLNSSIATGIDISDDTWHHVVITWDSITGDLNVYDNAGDALPDFTMAGFQAGNIPNQFGDLVLGQEQDGTGASGTYTFSGSQALEGSLDEFALYPFVLTPAQVAAHFEAGLNNRFIAPEPSSFVLCGLSLLGVSRRRKRSRGG